MVGGHRSAETAAVGMGEGMVAAMEHRPAAMVVMAVVVTVGVVRQPRLPQVVEMAGGVLAAGVTVPSVVCASTGGGISAGPVSGVPRC